MCTLIDIHLFALDFAQHSKTSLNCLLGRVSVMTLTKKQRKEQKKMDRRHKANQLRKNKKDMVILFLFHMKKNLL